MARLEFLPNSPVLLNAGSERELFSACFVLPVEDTINSIFHSLSLMAKIQQAGGGTGFSFSRLRPKGARVGAHLGVAAGPVGFMRIFDPATQRNPSSFSKIYR
jgi:ribonucleoside-diphosphate reductase alpha chain